jgi:hypothetical protein
MLACAFLALFSFSVNIPIGIWREHYKRFSLPWILIVHVSVPVIILLRIYLKANPYFIPLFIALAIAGQYAGNKIWHRKK